MAKIKIFQYKQVSRKEYFLNFIFYEVFWVMQMFENFGIERLCKYWIIPVLAEN